MNRLKNLAMLCLVVSVSTTTLAQSNIGIKAGANFADMNGRIDGDTDDDTKMNIGFNFGVVANFPFTNVLGLETGLVIDSKGHEYRFDDDGDFSDKAEYGKIVTKVMYLDIPINLKAQFEGENSRFFVQFGPYIGFALNGVVKATGELKDDLDDMGFDTDDALEIGGSAEDHDLKGTDVGLNIGTGLGFGDIEIGLMYDLGLANILPGGDSDNYIRNHVLKCTIAYSIGKKE